METIRHEYQSDYLKFKFNTKTIPEIQLIELELINVLSDSRGKIRDMCTSILNAGGNRIRPLLTMYSGKIRYYFLLLLQCLYLLFYCVFERLFYLINTWQEGLLPLFCEIEGILKCCTFLKIFLRKILSSLRIILCLYNKK